MDIVRILRKRWQQKKWLASYRDFWWGNYSWLLYHVRRIPLPGRNRLRLIRLTNVAAPFAMRLGSSDFPVIQEIFVEGEYEAVVDAGLEGVPTIVDLGANIGISLRYWLTRFPRAVVIGVEPDADNVEMCRQNLKLIGDPPQIRVIQACVGGSNRQVALDRAGGAWAIRMREPSSGERAEVPVYDFPTLLQQCGNPAVIDLLKCDIEGAERELFADCSAWISRVQRIVIELHWPYMIDSLLKDLQRANAQFEVKPLYMAEQLQVHLLTAVRSGHEPHQEAALIDRNAAGLSTRS